MYRQGENRPKYEFGCKSSFVSTNKEGFLIGALALHGNPYDGHTLPTALEQAERLIGKGRLRDIFVDQRYKGHGCGENYTIHICGRSGGKKSRSLRHWRRRRAAITPLIGHMKNDGRLRRIFFQLELTSGMASHLLNCA
jgi:IS5 family transposase